LGKKWPAAKAEAQKMQSAFSQGKRSRHQEKPAADEEKRCSCYLGNYERLSYQS
jgi:hypothetical protein